MLTTCLSAPSVLYVPSILLTCHSAPSVSLFLPPIMLPNHNSSPSVCSICAFLPCFPPLVNHSAPFSPFCSSPSFPPPMLPLLPDHVSSVLPCAPINRVHAPRRSSKDLTIQSRGTIDLPCLLFVINAACVNR